MGRKIIIFICVAEFSELTACGGGGGGSSEPTNQLGPTPPPAIPRPTVNLSVAESTTSLSVNLS